LLKTESQVSTLSYKTVSANKATVTKEWLLVDAEGETLGRLASKVAKLIRGKHKTNFTPHVDCGDNVVVLNADKVVLTGKKLDQKEYVRHTGYPGGRRVTSAKDMLDKHPERLLMFAVKGMLPKNKLGDAILKNLRVFAGSEHTHAAQNPRVINLNEIKL
jgi:large subunit ribosomal protein L13